MSQPSATLGLPGGGAVGLGIKGVPRPDVWFYTGESRSGRSRSANLLEHLYFAHIACLYCCYSTMLTVSFALFSVLLLVPSTAAVCQLCFGEAASLGCNGAVDTCPWGAAMALYQKRPAAQTALTPNNLPRQLHAIVLAKP